MECLKIILPIINTWILAYIWYQVWKKQEISKIQKENWLRFLSLLKRYVLSISNLRNWNFQLYETEELIYQERWNQLIKIWIELQNEHTLTELIFPGSKEEIKLTQLAELQNDLKINLDNYLDRKHRKAWKWDENDKKIIEIIMKSSNTSDEFWEKIQNEINSLSDPIKAQLSEQFNIKF